MDILEHQPVNKLCVQAGKSPMETKCFSVAAGSHPNLPQTLVNEWHQMLKSRRTDIFDDKWAPIQILHLCFSKAETDRDFGPTTCH